MWWLLEKPVEKKDKPQFSVLGTGLASLSTSRHKVNR